MHGCMNCINPTSRYSLTLYNSCQYACKYYCAQEIHLFDHGTVWLYAWTERAVSDCEYYIDQNAAKIPLPNAK